MDRCDEGSFRAGNLNMWDATKSRVSRVIPVKGWGFSDKGEAAEVIVVTQSWTKVVTRILFALWCLTSKGFLFLKKEN